MGLGESKKALIAGIGLLFAVGSAFSDVVFDDFDDGDSRNALGTYWYFYTDYANDGKSTIGGINDEPTFLGEYEGGKEGSYCARMDFELCKHDEDVMGQYNLPNVNLGVNFNKDETAFDLTGAEAISFDIKASKDMVVRFLVQMDKTVKVEDNDYHRLIDVTETWQTVTVLLEKDPVAGLQQEKGWGKTADFDISKLTKLAWRIGVKDNEELEGKSGILYIDNIIIVGNPNIKIHGEVDSIVPIGSFTGDGLLSDFEDEDNPFANNLGYYWYTYTDESSVFTTGVDNGDLVLGDGADGSKGIAVDIKLGYKYYDESADDSVPPYLGFGTNLRSDSKASNPYYDAEADGATGIYLEYKSDIPVNLELLDNKNRGGGVDYYVVLPSSKGKWQGAVILFKDFVLPDWASGTALDKTKLGKIQFKITGKPETMGSFAIDNLYLMNATLTSVKPLKSKISANGVVINHNRNTINVNFNRSLGNATLSLVDPMGKVVALEKINPNSRACSISLLNKASGVYFLKVASSNFVETEKIYIAK